MLCWYGRLVTSYKDGDLIQAVQSKDGKIIIGRIKLPESHFSDSWYVETREARLHGKLPVYDAKLYVHTSNPSAAQKFMLAKEHLASYGIELIRKHY